MAELIDKNHVLPHRLFAMVAAVNECPNISRAQLLRLLQPTVLNESTETSGNIFVKLRICGLISETQDRQRTAQLIIDPSVATDFEKFRQNMQLVVLGIVNDEQDHAILNLFAAWFAVQDDWVVNTSKSEWEVKFNNDLFPNRRERAISEHPGITSWMEWAVFLGWGWQLKFGSQETSFVPDCTLRLNPLVGDLIPEADFIPFGTFMERLSTKCPELDGGALFERCWDASRPNEQRGHRLSLMLSTALRVLNQRASISLEYRADATDNWSLFPAQSYISRVTHIRKGSN